MPPQDYYLTPELQRRIAGERLAVVDEMISAGSSVRATVTAASEAGASVVVVGALVVLVVHSDTVATVCCTACSHAWSAEIAAIPNSARQHLGLVPPIRGSAA
jgi:hypothetical protein